MDPVLFSLLIQPNHTLFSFCTYCSLTANTFFHSIQLILCFQQAGEIDTLTESLGKSILVVLCAGSRLLLTPTNFLAPLLLVSQQHLQKRLPSPTGSIKPWFLTEGKLVVVLIIPSSWVPNGSLLGEHHSCHNLASTELVEKGVRIGFRHRSAP